MLTFSSPLTGTCSYKLQDFVGTKFYWPMAYWPVATCPCWWQL